jgi:hypothetical protein
MGTQKSFLKPKDKKGKEAVDLPQMILELQRFHEKECSLSPGAYQLMVTLFLAFNEHLGKVGNNKEKTVWITPIIQMTNKQLLHRSKWKSEKTLIAKRQELVDAGILLYEEGKALSKGSLYRIRFTDTDVNALKNEVQKNRSTTVNHTVRTTVNRTPLNGSTTVNHTVQTPPTTVNGTVVSTVNHTPPTTVNHTPPYIDSLHKNESYHIKKNKEYIRELKKKENFLENRTRNLQAKNKEFPLKYVGMVGSVKLSEYPMGDAFYQTHKKCIEGILEMVKVDDTIKDGQISCSTTQDKTAVLLSAETTVYYRITEDAEF